MKINRGNTPPAESRPKAQPVSPKRWTFSFRYWREVRYFGLSESAPKWFVSLLEKLQELSKYEVDEFLAQRDTKSWWRYHDINWQSKNVPIARQDCNWIDSDYLDNPEEYPFVQFQISKALGRVVGFWDQDQIFNIVLLDPLHNIQPSKDYDYAVTPSNPLGCEYSALLATVDSLRGELICDGKHCEARAAFAELARPNPRSQVVIIGLDGGDLDQIQSLLRAHSGLTLLEILRSGIRIVAES